MVEFAIGYISACRPADWFSTRRMRARSSRAPTSVAPTAGVRARAAGSRCSTGCRRPTRVASASRASPSIRPMRRSSTSRRAPISTNVAATARSCARPMAATSAPMRTGRAADWTCRATSSRWHWPCLICRNAATDARGRSTVISTWPRNCVPSATPGAAPRR
mgnify:CR=1 FL=1